MHYIEDIETRFIDRTKKTKAWHYDVESKRELWRTFCWSYLKSEESFRFFGLRILLALITFGGLWLGWGIVGGLSLPSAINNPLLAVFDIGLWAVGLGTLIMSIYWGYQIKKMFNAVVSDPDADYFKLESTAFIGHSTIHCDDHLDRYIGNAYIQLANVFRAGIVAQITIGFIFFVTNGFDTRLIDWASALGTFFVFFASVAVMDILSQTNFVVPYRSWEATSDPNEYEQQRRDKIINFLETKIAKPDGLDPKELCNPITLDYYSETEIDQLYKISGKERGLINAKLEPLSRQLINIKGILPSANVRQYTKVFQFIETHPQTFPEFSPVLDSIGHIMKTAEYIDALGADQKITTPDDHQKYEDQLKDLIAQNRSDVKKILALIKRNRTVYLESRLAMDEQKHLGLFADDNAVTKTPSI